MPSEFKICIDCKKEWEYTEEEQFYIAGHNDREGNPFTPPKRCKPCRIEKKNRMGGNREQFQDRRNTEGGY